VSREKLFWPLVFLAFTAAGAVFLQGGYAHYEGQFFLVNYLDGRGPLSKIFSAHFNEWDCYQGRELSFVFGWLDAEAIRYSARLGWVQLLSATHFAALFGIAITLWRALPRLLPALGRRHAGLLVVLLLTAPAAMFSGYYYRPAKILAAFFLAVVIATLARIRERGAASTWMLVALSVTATAMGMSDRLGVYTILLLLIAVVTARRSDRLTIRIGIALLTALAANVVWSTVFGPRLSRVVDGYRPDTLDQVVHLRFTYLHGAHYQPALSLLRDHVEYLFGNFGLVSLVLVSCLTAAVLWRARDRRLNLTVAVIALATAAVYVAMYARLSSLPWPASRRVYYWLPQLVVMTVFAAVLVERSARVFPRAARLITPVLLIMIAGNLFSLRGHSEAIRSQEHKPWIAQSPLVRACIRDVTRPVSDFALDAPYAQVCGSLRAAVAGVSWNGLPTARPNPQLFCRRIERDGT